MTIRPNTNAATTNAKKNDDFSYEVVEKCGILSERNGYRKELRVISWNGKEPKFDIRTWYTDRNGDENFLSKAKGGAMSFTEEELYQLYKILSEAVQEGGEEA